MCQIDLLPPKSPSEKLNLIIRENKSTCFEAQWLDYEIFEGRHRYFGTFSKYICSVDLIQNLQRKVSDDVLGTKVCWSSNVSISSHQGFFTSSKINTGNHPFTSSRLERSVRFANSVRLWEGSRSTVAVQTCWFASDTEISLRMHWSREFHSKSYHNL